MSKTAAKSQSLADQSDYGDRQSNHSAQTKSPEPQFDPSFFDELIEEQLNKAEQSEDLNDQIVCHAY